MKARLALISALIFLFSCKKPNPTEIPQPDVVITSFTAHAKGGESITISGNGFSTTVTENVVKINGVQATVTAATATSLTVTVPAKVGDGKIDVVVKAKTATSTTDFVYDWVYTVSTFAGSGLPGYQDGATTSAMFNTPGGLAFDQNGNLFVADIQNSVIRKITTQGAVTTFCGGGIGGPGWLDGTGNSARFSYPNSLAIDVTGNMYVTDYGNQKIRVVSPIGVVSTLAGSSFGFADGLGSSAQFRDLAGIVIGTDQNIYVTDRTNFRIRKITKQGMVSTFAGSGSAGSLDGPGSSAQFNIPFGLIDDRNGNLFVTEYDGNRIREISTQGQVSTFVGSGIAGYTDGVGISARFSGPSSLVFDQQENLYVVDAMNSIIRVVTKAGVVTTIAGMPNVTGNIDGAGSVARFKNPLGIAIDANGNLYVSDTGNNTIRKIVKS